MAYTEEQPSSVKKRAMICVIVGLITLLSLAAFIQYRAFTLPQSSAATLKPTDGLVVATGGQTRIAAGLALMAKGQAKRMLLTGVGSGITRDMLAASLGLNAEAKAQLACCVDLDFTAADTRGNAIATAKWMRQRGFTSLTLVTANYHLARASLDFTHLMPDYEMYYFAVSPEALRPEDWYHDWQVARLILRESGKYIATLFRYAITDRPVIPDLQK